MKSHLRIVGTRDTFENCQRSPAFVDRPQRPFARRHLNVCLRLSKQPRNIRESSAGSKNAEDGFAGVKRGIVREVIALEFAYLDREETSRQSLIDRISLQTGSQSSHFSDVVRNSVLAEVGKEIVVSVNSEKARAHRSATAVRLEESVQCGS